MSINLKFYSPRSGGAGGTSSPGVNSSNKYARVVDIVTSENHPDYSYWGKSLSINGIRYRVIGSNKVEDQTELPFAYQADSNFKTSPVIGEIVEIINAPSEGMNLSPEIGKTYYTRVTSIWNQVNHNAFPDLRQNPGQADLGKDIPELPKIRPLHPFFGNTSIEGRLGQSIRFFGYKSDYNTFTDDSNNGQPITIFRNGQKGSILNESTVVEDINLDDSSIYLTSNHKISLKQANSKRTSYFQPPINADAFKGKQILLNSDRVFINGKKEDIMLSSVKNIGLSSKTVNFDGIDFVSMDGKKVYLGDKGKTEKEWVVLGQQNENWLKDLLDLLNETGNTLATLPSNPVVAIGKLVILGSIIKAKVSLLKSKLPTLRSRKVYTE